MGRSARWGGLLDGGGGGGSARWGGLLDGGGLLGEVC